MKNENDIQWLPLDSIRPYEKNPRDNREAIPRVAESIRQFGFLSPIVADSDGVILAGHTRYAAAKSLGLTRVPVIVARDLTAEAAKAYRLADNKTAEFAKWDLGLLVEELDDLSQFDCDMASFGFDTSELFKRRAAWSRVEKLCDMKRRIKQHLHGDVSYTTMFETGKRGLSITEIKENPSNVEPFADCLVDYLERALGGNLSKDADWAMVTTPRRRHKDGFHFSTAVTQAAAEILHLPFYADAFRAETRNRIEPQFFLQTDPAERNVIVHDDIITTGETLRACRQLLLDSGHVVLSVIGIKN